MDVYVGTIMSSGFAFAPYQWTQCAGQIIPIQQNTALFSLCGTAFGGDGRTTFGLPDLRGKVAVGAGSTYVLGQTGGAESVTLSQSQLPQHSHAAPFTPTGGNVALSATLYGIADRGGPVNPGGNFISQGQATTPGSGLFAASGVMGTMPATATAVTGTNTGGGITGGTVALSPAGTATITPISVMQPYLTTYFSIALVGNFPPRV